MKKIFSNPYRLSSPSKYNLCQNNVSSHTSQTQKFQNQWFPLLIISTDFEDGQGFWNNSCFFRTKRKCCQSLFSQLILVLNSKTNLDEPFLLAFLAFYRSSRNLKTLWLFVQSKLYQILFQSLIQNTVDYQRWAFREYV